MNTIETRKGYCTTPFGQVHYWRTGRGPVCLLLHQASQAADEFRALAPWLCGDFDLLAVDYPGHGRSDDPDHELGVHEFAEAVMAVIDELGIQRAHACGHHSGGLVALDLAVRFPERIDRVVMSGIGVRTEAGTRAVLDRPMSRDLPVDEDGEFLAKTWQTYREMTSPGVEPEVTFDSFIVGLEARRRPYDAHIAMMSWDRDAVISRLARPTLLLVGEHDHFAERPGELLETIPDGSLVRVPGGGPFLFHEKPAECAAAIRGFLLGS